MNRSYNVLKQWAHDLGLVVAQDFFKTFSDPEARGSNFTWDRFPDLVAGYTKIQVFVQCSELEYKKFGKELEEIASQSAINMAKQLKEKENEE